MAAFPSTAYINEVLGLIKNDTPYIALYTSNPTAGDVGTEVTGGSYARQSVTFGTITSGSMANTNNITFSGLPSATITHYAIRDAVTGGTMRAYGTLNSTAATVSGDQINIPAGNITLSFAGS